MEISSQSSQRIAAILKHSANSTIESVVTLNELKLVPNQAYSAKVLALVNGNPPSSTSTHLETTQNLSAHQAIASEQSNTKADPKQWLVAIEGKIIIVETAISLAANQHITLQLKSIDNPKRPAELIMLPTQAALESALANPTRTSLIEDNSALLLKAMGQSLPRQVSLATGFAELQQQLHALKQRSSLSTNETHVKQLLQESIALLTQLLPQKQHFIRPYPDQELAANTLTIPPSPSASHSTVNLASSTGSPSNSDKQLLIADILRRIAGTSSASSAVPTQSQLKPGSSPNATLTDQQPIATKPTAPVTTSPSLSNAGDNRTPQTQAIVELLGNSGLMLEAKLLQEEKPLAHLRQQIDTIRTEKPEGLSRHLSPQNPSGAPLSHSPPSTNTPQLGNTESPLSNTPPQATAGAQTSTSPQGYRTIRTALQAALSTMVSSTKTAPVDKPGSANALNADLKANLISLVAGIKTGQTSTLTDKPYVDALSQTDLLKSPFNFPHLSEQNVLRANALLADQQLTTGQILKLLAGMLNRIQFNQLNSLYQSQHSSIEATSVQTWLFELPVATEQQQFNIFNLRLDREQSQHQEQRDKNAEQEVCWRIALSFELENLGAIHVHVTLTPPKASTTIWASNTETHQLIQRESPLFLQRLQELGLEPNPIECHKGKPKQDKTQLDRGFVDIKA